MAVTVFADMDTIMLAPLDLFIVSGSQGLMGSIKGPLKVGVTLYIILYGMFVLKGTIQEPLMDFVFKCMKIVIITLLATSSAEYNLYVKDLFFETLPNEIASALNTSPPEVNSFDSILQTSIDKGLELWGAAPWDFGIVYYAILTILIFFTGTAVAIIGFVISFYAKVALTLVLVLGPVFVALALFDSTRRFTEGWLGQLANFVILQVLVSAVGSLLLASMISLAKGIVAGNDPATAAVTFSAITLCSAFIFYQLPGIASSLAAGGAALSYGFGPKRDVRTGAPVTAAGGAYAGAKWVGGQASYWAGRGVSRMNNNTKQ